MNKSPLIRNYGNWIENLNDSIDLGDYWFRELDILNACEWFIERADLSDEQRELLLRAFPEIKLK